MRDSFEVKRTVWLFEPNLERFYFMACARFFEVLRDESVNLCSTNPFHVI